MKPIILLLLLTVAVRAQSNAVLVVNDETAPVPVVIVESKKDVWPSVQMGMSVGFLYFGFGMILRMAKKMAPNYDN